MRQQNSKMSSGKICKIAGKIAEKYAEFSKILRKNMQTI